MEELTLTQAPQLLLEAVPVLGHGNSPRSRNSCSLFGAVLTQLFCSAFCSLCSSAWFICPQRDTGILIPLQCCRKAERAASL